MFKKLKNIFNNLFKLKIEKIIETIGVFSTTEKVIFYALIIIFSISSIFLYRAINERFLIEVPLQGGSITEGVIGSPRFINPVLATSKADQDLNILIY